MPRKFYPLAQNCPESNAIRHKPTCRSMNSTVTSRRLGMTHFAALIALPSTASPSRLSASFKPMLCDSVAAGAARHHVDGELPPIVGRRLTSRNVSKMQ